MASSEDPPVVFRRPCLAELRPWVSAVWWCQGATAAESVLPAARAHLVLRLDSGWYAGVLHGPASRPRLVEPVPEELLIGVVFRPGGLRPVFGAPADSLADLSVPLSELWGRDGSRLASRLAGGAGGGGAPARAALLLDRVERALIARADRASDGTAQLIGDVQRGLRRGHSVAAVAAALAADRRTLGMLFRREVGFGLKRYGLKARHLALEPRVSLTYWDAAQDVVTVHATAAWVGDAPTRERIWQLYRTTPPPLGYDPGDFWPAGPHDPAFGLLRLRPTRIDITGLASSPKPKLTWRPGGTSGVQRHP